MQTLVIYTIAIIVALVTVCKLVAWLSRSRRAKKEAERILKQSARAEELLATYQTDPKARKVLYEDVGSWWLKYGLSEDLVERLEAARKQILLEDNRAKCLPSLNKRHEEYLAEQSLVGRADLLLQIISLLGQCQAEVLAEFTEITRLNASTAMEQVKQLILHRVQEL